MAPVYSMCMRAEAAAAALVAAASRIRPCLRRAVATRTRRIARRVTAAVAVRVRARIVCMQRRPRAVVCRMRRQRRRSTRPWLSLAMRCPRQGS